MDINKTLKDNQLKNVTGGNNPESETCETKLNSYIEVCTESKTKQACITCPKNPNKNNNKMFDNCVQLNQL